MLAAGWASFPNIGLACGFMPANTLDALKSCSTSNFYLSNMNPSMPRYRRSRKHEAMESQHAGTAEYLPEEWLLEIRVLMIRRCVAICNWLEGE